MSEKKDDKSEVEKDLEHLEKELSTFIAVKEKIEKSISKSEKDEITAKNRKPDTEKLIDWALQSTIAWSVILFTAILGLVGLLPEIHFYSGNLGEALLISLVIVYFGFLATLSLSIVRTSQLYGELVRYQIDLPKEIYDRFGKHENIYNQFFMHPRAAYVLSAVVTILFTLLVVFKIG